MNPFENPLTGLQVASGEEGHRSRPRGDRGTHPTYTHTLQLTPYTLHPAPYTLHPTPYTLPRPFPPRPRALSRQSPFHCRRLTSSHFELICGSAPEPKRLRVKAHCTGVPRSYGTPPFEDPTVGICLGPYGGPRRWGCS